MSGEGFTWGTEDRCDGACSPDGRIAGSYLHGMFSNDAFRAHWLAQFGVAHMGSYETTVDTTLDALADHISLHVDLDRFFAQAECPTLRPVKNCGFLANTL